MYDNPRIQRTGFTFTNANTTFGITKGPKGKKGTLYNYGIADASTATAGATTTPTMSVGITGTVGAYGAAFDFGVLAINKSKSIRSTYRPTDAGFATYILNKGRIPADVDLIATWVAATGGGAAGAGMGFVEIRWDD